MRLFTRAVDSDQVQHSYYVQFLFWLGDKILNRAENIVAREYSA